MEFKKVKLGEVARVKNGYAFKSKDFTDYGIPIIKIKNICPPLINIEECNYVSEELYNQTSQYCILKGDILISMTGSGPNQMNSAVGKVGRYLLNRKALQNQRVGKIEIIDEQKYDKDFLYYYLSQKNILEYFVNNSTGSANQANISKKIIENLMVPDFLKSTQRKIANILNALDSKIEINNKIISNLESQAQAIFKSWFVDFEPFQDGDFVESELGMIPKGWEVKELGELYPMKSGYAFKSKDWSDNGFPIIKIKNISNGSIDLSNVDYVNCKETLKKAISFKVTGGEIVMALTGATTGKFGVIPYNTSAYINQRAGLFFDKQEIGYGFLYGLLKQKKIINNIIELSQGSAQENLSPRDVNSLKIAFYKNITDIFNLLNYYIKKVSELKFQNTKLAELRDALLPKLMAGEIDVSNIKIEGEEVKNE